MRSRGSLPPKAISIVLTVLILFVSAALVALVARALYYVHHRYSEEHAVVSVQFWEYDFRNRTTGRFTSEGWTNEMFYYNFISLGLGDTNALLSAGVFGCVVGSIVLALSMWARKRPWQFTLSGRKVRRLHLVDGYAIFYLDGCLAVVSLIVACYAWAKWSKTFHRLDYSRYPAYHVNYTIQDDSSRVYTLEAWNCLLATNLVWNASSPSVAEMESLCAQGYAARLLIIALFALAVLRMLLKPIGHFLAWRRQNIEDREGRLRDGSPNIAKSLELGSMSADGQTSGGRWYELSSVKTTSVAELPADRMSKIEMDDDAALREMAGEDGRKEMEACIAAAEKDAGGRS